MFLLLPLVLEPALALPLALKSSEAVECECDGVKGGMGTKLW